MLHFIATPRRDYAACTRYLGELPFVAVPPLTVSFHSHAAAIFALTNHAFCVSCISDGQRADERHRSAQHGGVRSIGWLDVWL